MQRTHFRKMLSDVFSRRVRTILVSASVFIGVLGGNYSNSKLKEFYSSETSWGRLENGRARVKEVNTYSINHSSQLNFKKNFNQNHKIDAFVGFEVFHYNFEDFFNEVIGFENQTTGVNNISVGTAVSAYSTQRWATNRLSDLVTFLLLP